MVMKLYDYVSGMGTKIVERITTNQSGLKSVDHSGFIRFVVNGRQESSKETLTDEEEEGVFILRSMDRFLEKQNAESIRHTMQAQEDIFKQQVRYTCIYIYIYIFIIIWIWSFKQEIFKFMLSFEPNYILSSLSVFEKDDISV
jgi:hypothetical protein